MYILFEITQDGIKTALFLHTHKEIIKKRIRLLKNIFEMYSGTVKSQTCACQRINEFSLKLQIPLNDLL